MDLKQLRHKQRRLKQKAKKLNPLTVEQIIERHEKHSLPSSKNEFGFEDLTCLNAARLMKNPKSELIIKTMYWGK
jgi:hypothetical protein